MLLVCYINYQDRTIVMGNYIFNTVDQITSLQDLRHKYNGCKSAEYQRAKGRGTEASAHPSTQTDVQWNASFTVRSSLTISIKTFTLMDCMQYAATTSDTVVT